MNGLVNSAVNALGGRFRSQLEQTSGQTLEQIQQAVQNGDEKGLCWLQKAADEVRKRNPQLYAQMQRMAGGRNPFPGQR
jgi:hypothetical protein